jgi:mannose-6-phosphate isomerase-like protein (cupin superfamily)
VACNNMEHVAGKNEKSICVHMVMDNEEVTLEPGCSLGFHMHYGESETYYILTGEGEYNDNGTSWRHVKAGDITFTPDGRGHGLANTGNTDLVFMALIIKD